MARPRPQQSAWLQALTTSQSPTPTDVRSPVQSSCVRCKFFVISPFLVLPEYSFLRPCMCTLTQGYWKTHSPASGTASLDQTWTSCSCFTTAFFKCGNTWQWYLDAPTKGNAVIISAKQFIAAHLNFLKNGFSADLLANWSFNPTLGNCYLKLKSAYSSTCASTQGFTAADMITCANLLESFNAGLVQGVPHCEQAK